MVSPETRAPSQCDRQIRPAEQAPGIINSGFYVALRNDSNVSDPDSDTAPPVFRQYRQVKENPPRLAAGVCGSRDRKSMNRSG